MDLFPSSGEGRKTHTLLGHLESANRVQWLTLVLSKRPNIVGASLPSPEDGNTSSFRNVAFSIYLEFRKMDTDQNLMILGVMHLCQLVLQLIQRR
jgi:hypothetical protein